MNMVRVLHMISSLHIGGAQAFLINIYNNIDREKVQFDFVVCEEERSELYDVVENMGGKIYICPQYIGKNHFTYCRWWSSFLNKHNEYKVIHGHNRSTSAIYLKIAKRYGIITIAHSHSTSNGRGISGVTKNIMQWPTRYVADYLFACSDRAGKWMFGNSVVNKKNYEVIRNGIDCPKFAFNPRIREKLRKQLNVSDCFVIGNIGRITEAKNHQFLLEAFAEVHRQRLDARLLLVGDGDLMEVAKQKSRILQIEDAVIFAGAKTNTQDYYQAMDVFAFPSLWEGLGIVAIEAQAAGLPVLISENVPNDVELTDKVYRVPLRQGVMGWASELLKLSINSDRTAGAVAVAKAGYDISQTAEHLQNFYIERAKEV